MLYSGSSLGYLDLSLSVNVEGAFNQSIVDDGSNTMRMVARQIIAAGNKKVFFVSDITSRN